MTPAPMEAKLAEALPEGEGWQFEPKWDGFRAIATRDGDALELTSKSGKPLGRYFPEIVDLLLATGAERFTIDGEIVGPSFDALQMRLHPAASRIAKLSRETPAQLMLFDCLSLGGRDLSDRPLAERRSALEDFHRREGNTALLLSPATRDRATALGWLERSGGALDGVVAKRLDQPYRSGERAMIKVKVRRTADCVVGGWRADDAGGAASLLLGLYDERGKLDHVGFTANLTERDAWAAELRSLAGAGFTGKAPGGPSRWARDKDNSYLPLRPELVVEVLYDQVTGRRFRHGTRLLRRRPDKAPAQCTFEQLAPALKVGEVAALFSQSL